MAHHGDENPITMDPRFSAKVYPRKDNIFQHKKSLNFDLIRSSTLQGEGEGKVMLCPVSCIQRTFANVTMFREWSRLELSSAANTG